ncbi:MAG: sugar transferase [Akkermansiaceae bacterium]|jgi:exopolysaccharide biosynthesis polyprenyl glycosylphosphotransferase|nr:sugar transferase [Akkermansiaceae bacterium]MDP4721645.1 sugar transferase [Akkermansiaceae bacterium]MDP4778817.1 sugar transferase [Akkermansiaceae bacterium]MDP4846982.1 sugar transferase [Akkermansiaceae bacterium]
MASSRKDSFRNQVLQIADALLVWLAFALANLLRYPMREWLFQDKTSDDGLNAMTWALYIAVPFTPLVLEHFNFYHRISSKTTRAAVWQLIRGIFVIGVVISVFAVFSNIEGTRRLVLALGAVFIFILLLIRDRTYSWWISRKKRQGGAGERVVIVGSKSEIDDLLQDLDAEAISDWDIVERFDLATHSVSDLYEILKTESIGRVVFAAKTSEFEKVASAVEVCELQGVEAWIAASFIRTQIARPTFDSVGSKPMLVLRSTPELSWELMAKELMDRIGSLLIIVFSLPLWVITAIGIKIASPGAPVMFSQLRCGRYGKPFKIRKFRTMVPNAEELLESIKKEHGNEMDGPVFKLGQDPRIFRFGSFLRKFSIDELPQLINVLTGEMSLVGPRPLPLYEVEAFGEISHRRRLSVKPGITCEWQAGGRSKITSFEDWVEMDLRYIDNWSLWLDCQIIIRTIPAVLLAKGAS